MAGAADVQSFWISRTVGGESGSAWGETLLEVERTSDGSLVRFVYAGFGDFVCRRRTVMVWQKKIVGKTPAELARPANLCPSDRSIRSLESRLDRQRRKEIIYGTEHDAATLHVQCAEGRQVALPIELADRFESSVKTAGWGQYMPDIYVVDPVAERDGQEFVSARQSEYGQDSTSKMLRRLLLGYQGPIGKPVHDWRVEPEAGIRLRGFVEPREVELAWAPSKSAVLPFRLTLDRRTGKVTKSEALVDWNDSQYVSAVWGASLGWVFDPSTIPENPVVNVRVHFQANCGGKN